MINKENDDLKFENHTLKEELRKTKELNAKITSERKKDIQLTAMNNTQEGGSMLPVSFIHSKCPGSETNVDELLVTNRKLKDRNDELEAKLLIKSNL